MCTNNMFWLRYKKFDILFHTLTYLGGGGGGMGELYEAF